MSDRSMITLYPDNQAQLEQIATHAEKQDESVSRYCLKATKQRINRELQDEDDDLVVTSAVDQRTDSHTLSVQLEAIARDITDAIASVSDVDTQPERVYSVALWKLLAGEFSSEQRASALEAAPEILDQRVTELQDQAGEDQ